jgi:hypothetical protein
MESPITKKKLTQKRKAVPTHAEEKPVKVSKSKAMKSTSDAPAAKKAKKVQEKKPVEESEDEEEEQEEEEVAQEAEAEEAVPLHNSDEHILEGNFDPNAANIDYSFDSLNINENTRKAIKDMGFEKMTEVQARTIPILLVRLLLLVHILVRFIFSLPSYSSYRKVVMSSVPPRPALVRLLLSLFLPLSSFSALSSRLVTVLV